MSVNDGKKILKAPNGKPHTSLSYSDSDNESLPEIECKLCNKSFISMNAYQQHIHSKKHYNQLTKQKISAKAAIDKLVEDQSNSDDDDNSKHTELTCDVCSKIFYGYKPYASHLHGSTHAKNLKKQALKEKMKHVPGIESDNEGSEDDWMPKVVAKCTLCEKEFTDLESFRKHLGGSIHKKKIQEEKILQKIKDEHAGSDGEVSDDFYKKCEVCDKGFSGLQPYRVHMKSLVHKKALKRIEMANKIKDLCTKESTEKDFICKECEHSFPDPFAFQSHLDNNSHKKYEAKKVIKDIVSSHPEIVVSKAIVNNPEDSDDEEEYRVGDYILVCKLCHNSFSGPQSALDHVKSKKHVRAKQERAALKLIREKQKSKATRDEPESKRKSENGTKNDANKASLKMLNGAKDEEDDDFEHI